MYQAFAVGENNVKGRVKDVLRYRKPSLWIACAAFIACIVVGISFLTESVETKVTATDDSTPFCIRIDQPKIIQDDKQKRLVISVDINNETERDFKNVWFELQLNEEVKPYLASHIIKYTSDKMNITSQEKAIHEIGTNNAFFSQKKPLICGFEHEWVCLLTTEDELNEYYKLSSDGIQEALKDIMVSIYWKGGKQEISIPIFIG